MCVCVCVCMCVCVCFVLGLCPCFPIIGAVSPSTEVLGYPTLSPLLLSSPPKYVLLRCQKTYSSVKYDYSRTPLIWINWDGETFRNAKNPGN